MLVSIIKFKSLLFLMKSVNTGKRKTTLNLFKAHLFLMMLFFLGYLIIGAAFCYELSIVSKIFVAAIFFFGAIFVLLGIIIQNIMISEITKHITAYEQTNRLAAIGQLAGGMAHEINNPLSVILGFTQILIRETKDGDPSCTPLKSIEQEARRCSKMVKDLLTFARIEKTFFKLSNINSIIEDALYLIKTRAKTQNIEILVNFSENIPEIALNSNQIQQVIINLCNNAIDAMPQGGKIAITTKKLEKEVEITVSDTGTGISEEVKKHLFEPFFTTKEVGKGAGLGLSLVYEIVKKHNGSIEVESESNKSAAFKIKLPIKGLEKC